MRIGVIADTHIPDRSKDIPAAILKDFRNVDIIIHAGDLVDARVLERLKTACSDVRAVYGNMDPDSVRKKLTEKIIVEVSGKRIGVMHGKGHPDTLVDFLTRNFKDDRVDAIIFGHSHKAVIEKRGGILFFNPGSATDKVFSLHNSYGIMEINDTIEAKIITLET